MDTAPIASTSLPWQEFARAPLVPFALAATLGLIVDRYLGVTLEAELFVAIAAIAGWWYSQSRFAPLGLCLCLAALAAAHHHIYRQVFPADDIGRIADTRPALVRVRGILDETPIFRHSNSDLFGPARRVERAVAYLYATELRDDANRWQPASGRLRLSIERVANEGDGRFLDAVRVGDEVEMTGLLSRPLPPGNPGEWDYAEHFLDERIRGELRATKTDEALTRLDDSGRRFAILARIRGYFTKLLDEAFPPRTAALARALLLGDGSAMDRDEWDAFARTGVIHVLAISGQHLVILAGFVWWTLRILGSSRQRGAVVVIALIVGYALLTGLRPSATRAAVMVVVVCLGLLLRRPIHTANTFALAWLIVLGINPTDPFTSGCQLSFLSVFVLMWGTTRWFAPKPQTAMEAFLDEMRPLPVKIWHGAIRAVLVAYGITLVLTIANAPIVMLRQNVVPPIGVVIGPVLVLLTTIALLSGFLLLLVGSVPPLGSITSISLSWCDALVQFADRLPGGSVYTSTPPVWWVVGFYVLLIAYVSWVDRRLLIALVVWLCLGLVGQPRGTSDEFRIAFLSVGHGGCTVWELPDGRVMLYDAGTMSGPESVRRIVAPYLWSRGIGQIDELLLSHADLDHFNNVPELLRRFPVGQVTMTPSFATKPTREVAEVLLSFAQHRVPMRLAVAGDRFAAGAVTFDVLHPPPEGPPGNENERSLVLKVTHGERTFLFTGDLEKAGMARVLGLPPVSCDVLMAPHHGSLGAFSPEFAKWASPRFIAVNRGNRSETSIQEGAAGLTPIWDTWTAGAITVRSNPTGVTVEAFRTGERSVVRKPRK